MPGAARSFSKLSPPPFAAVVPLAALVLSLSGCLSGSTAGPQEPSPGTNPPRPAASSSVHPLASSLTRDGITWTFSKPVPYGQFLNGDYYVIGPVTVAAITPEPSSQPPYRNGSVVNPPFANDLSGFDDRAPENRFSARLRAPLPIHLKPGDALVSSISVKNIGALKRVMRRFEATHSPVKSISILTVLSGPAAQDTFRPSYCDRSQNLYSGRNLKRSMLPSLRKPAGAPSLDEFADYFRRPWWDVNRFLNDAPVEYMPDYGREVGLAVSYAALLLTLDYPAQQKEPLTNYLLQYGIDLFGCLEAGYGGWPALGGHGSGRKFPIVFAGLLLDQPRMKQVGQLYPEKFGEDMQTVYVHQVPPPGTYQRAWQGATVIYGGHVGAGGSFLHRGWGGYEHLPPREWANDTGESYRRCCTSVAWVGQALALRLLRAEPVWNHPAFFDYADRWMMEDDSQAVEEIFRQTGWDFRRDWARQGQTRFLLEGGTANPDFIDDMWKAYRRPPR